MMNGYTQMAYNQQGFEMMLAEQQHQQQQYLTTQSNQASFQTGERQSVKDITKKESASERSTRRKQATQREKRRMEKLNHCIEDIKQIVCPEMKAPTKAKILREAINRIEYLERITQQMLDKFGGNIDQALPGFKEQQAQQQQQQTNNENKKSPYDSSSSDATYYGASSSTSPASDVTYHQYNSPVTMTLPSVASLANSKAESTESEISFTYQDEQPQATQQYTQQQQQAYTVTEGDFKLEPATFYQDQPAGAYY